MVRSRTFIVIGFVVMSFNSLYQYAWNALLPLFKSGFNASLVEIEVAFTLFTVFSTTSQIIGGSIADYRGPKGIGIISALLSAFGFLGTSFSSSIYEFYMFWSLGSIGEGILYGITANLAVKWFPKKRGFATGFVSLGFGLGSAIANPFITSATNFRLPTLVIGLVELMILPVLLFIVDYPKRVKGEKPTKVVRTLTWWLIYVSFATSAVPLTVLSSSLSVLSPKDLLVLLVTIFPLLSGISRPIIGYISDKLGRERTTSAVLFVMILGSIFFLFNLVFPSVLLIGFFGGSMITLFFALSGDIFGEKYSTSNNAILYTGKAVAGVLGSTVFSLLLLYDPFYARLFVLINAVIGFLLIFLVTKGSSSSKVVS